MKVEELEESLNKISQELRVISTQIFQYKEALKYAYTNHNQLCLTLYRIFSKFRNCNDDRSLRKTITDSIKMNYGSSCFGERNMEAEMSKIINPSSNNNGNV